MRDDMKGRILLVGGDCSHGASVSASAAADACVGIDRINITFLDCAYRALAKTSTASNAGVRINFVCHNNKNCVLNIQLKSSWHKSSAKN